MLALLFGAISLLYATVGQAGGNQLSRVDGFGIVFPKRDAAHGADAHRGIDLLKRGSSIA
jgi:hypothetical protein